ncbi:ACP S-malonyltransferase [Chromobacterium piscinae]|uniref:Malonyl CoA-acyl carrier protein transacylase n=1 Tax=Chromobacterium piscinae TaxID=686831 RepID=A0ABV0H0E0_9NEIS|nr:ACP S-malonyltransferase [Chromobacterium piscinae]MBX9295429.1 ACP S-malonyltransferase [Chromobacterium vaccinii]MBX9356298.1 ACP S-malonyltransferase [Chromobacterium vaccinii]MCD4505829.1 ACP S-malonyltransferase [Chromobacterium piscinae]MCD5326350.1 ACP S-malonyltransferase [Chromobacterium piscinae]NHQ80081.1 ACP S-malonyltransferase [Chromobacterium vaccinii]
MAFAFLFPGQGSQSLKMMDGFADLPVVQHTFEEASDTLSLDLWAMLQADGADARNATVNTQPIMLAAGYATYLAWQELNGKQPSIVAGHSLGEYTALVAAGALPFSEAVKLVRVRAEAMQAAVPAGAGAMAAIINLSNEDIHAACIEAAQGEVVEAANFNSSGQVVIAGHTAAVERAIELCKAKGAKRALPLPVSVPSHCSLMRPAAERLAEALQDVHLSAPAIPVLHNADVASYSDVSQIRDALIRQLYMPVRWTETIQKLAADGVTMMAECGPGKVLAGLAKRIDSDITCLALTNRAALEAAREELV